MEVTLLYFEDCPSWRQTDDHLGALVCEMPELTVRHQIVDTVQAAEQHRFFGSPSIQVHGIDLFADPRAQVGLACRMYTTPDGPSGSPTLEQLRAALSR